MDEYYSGYLHVLLIIGKNVYQIYSYEWLLLISKSFLHIIINSSLYNASTTAIPVEIMNRPDLVGIVGAPHSLTGWVDIPQRVVQAVGVPVEILRVVGCLHVGGGTEEASGGEFRLGNVPVSGRGGTRLLYRNPARHAISRRIVIIHHHLPHGGQPAQKHNYCQFPTHTAKVVFIFGL